MKLKRDRLIARGGLTLIEVVIALSVFSILATTVSSGMFTSIKASGAAWRMNKAMSGARDRIAEIQEATNANRPGVYNAYNGSSKKVSIPGLSGGTIQADFYINETTVPSVFGGARDLNMDGDAGDALLPSDVKLLPCKLTIDWPDGQGQGHLEIYHLFTETKE
jgi:prepilin-type N-terminal cleavage/methylation domain-containing protein